MSKKSFKSQASSSRVVSSPFQSSGFGSPAAKSLTIGFGNVPASSLAYVYEPPDLTNVSEASVVVSLKNVQKKDGTTKAKALDELLAFMGTLVANQEGLDEAVLEAWMNLYPRVSIDSSRRVRQAAHSLQGQMAIAAGRRIAKHMPRVIGAWLSGSHDVDKLVARTALASYKDLFPTLEKQVGACKAYHAYVLQHCKDVILNESVNSLSDMRTVNKDDAEAKYARVLGSAIATLTELLGNLAKDELQKQQNEWQYLLQAKQLWRNCAFDDAFVRRCIYQLLFTVLDQMPELLDVSVVSQPMIYDATKSELTGSAIDYVKSLTKLTVSWPTAWTTQYTGTGKKSPIRGLSHLLRKGSCGSNSTYWNELSILLQSIPEEVIFQKASEIASPQSDHENAEDNFLQEFLLGIGRKENLGQDNAAAWDAYLRFIARFMSVPQQVDWLAFCKAHVLPLVTQFLVPSSNTVRWYMSNDQRRLCTQATILTCRVAPAAAIEVIKQISNEIIEKVQISLPEHSKDYNKSQDSLIRDIGRWYEYIGSILTNEKTQSLRESVIENTVSERVVAIKILKNRHGKPYSAAMMLETQCRKLSEITLKQETAKLELTSFIRDNLPSLATTPAAPHLFQLLELLSTAQDLRKTYEGSLQAIRNAPESPSRTRALEMLLTSTWPEDSQARSSLISIVTQSLDASLGGKATTWNLVRVTLRNNSTPLELTDSILSTLTNSLSLKEQADSALFGLEAAVQGSTSVVRAYISSKQGAALLSKLLFLAQSHDDEVVREHAVKLKATVDRLLSGGAASATATDSLIEVIKTSVYEASSLAISITSLIEQAKKMLSANLSILTAKSSSKLLPDIQVQTSIFGHHTKKVPNPSLAFTNPLQGAVHLVKKPFISLKTTEPTVNFDREGYSLFLRVSMYVLGLTEVHGFMESLDLSNQVHLSHTLALSYQLLTDYLNVPTYPSLWQFSPEDHEQESMEPLFNFQRKLKDWLSNLTGLRPSFYPKLIERLFSEAESGFPLGYYNARAYAALVREENERHGHISWRGDEAHLSQVRRSMAFVQSTAYLSTTAESNTLLRVCNEVMSDLSGIQLSNEASEGLDRAVLLNALLDVIDERREDLPQQRLVFFLKHIIPYLTDQHAVQPLLSELYRTANYILPLLKDLYGEFWEDILITVVQRLSDPVSELYTRHSLLRLVGTFRFLLDGDVNEDLQDAWQEQRPQLGNAMFRVLNIQSKLDDTAHQPLKMVNELLAHQIITSQFEYKGDIAELLPLLQSPSTSIQRAAYIFLSESIKKNQEQESLDDALSENFDAKLPKELLSLIDNIPHQDDFLDIDSVSEVPASVLRFLLGWKLIFMHWENASYSLQSRYVDILKDRAYVQDLLGLTFNVLIAQRSPKSVIDPSRLPSIKTYSPSDNDGPATEIQRLLVHLYYLCLKHVPHQAKKWWLDACPRALEKPVIEWTGKYIGPLVAVAELETVSSWEPNPDSTTALEVKVNTQAYEILARYPIDERFMAIRISLPAAYPLHPAAVVTQERVGVDERRWSAWINTTAIAINFASSSQGLGSVVDGLVAWRRNVAGTLRGQSECAICYSVVSADGQLPTKRCGTCRNTFHGSCLFRWFKSSSSSSCPLCRNAFNYA